MPVAWSGSQPWGIRDLEEKVEQRENRVRCVVRGCSQWMRRRARGSKDEFCPDHGISVSLSPTYVFGDWKKNIIVATDDLEAVKQHKVESWRLGNERSEDAVTWNFFISLLQMGLLPRALCALAGDETIQEEPELYLWGTRIAGSRFERWKALDSVRKELEDRPGIPTEPDVVLRLPGRLLLLVEVKLASKNGIFDEERFGSLDEYLLRYRSREGSPDPLAREWIVQQEPQRVLEQLCRNVVFAHWLAERGERPMVVNLVPEQREVDVEERFRTHLSPGGDVAFRRVSWEQLILATGVFSSADAIPLRDYLENKTVGLKRAFVL